VDLDSRKEVLEDCNEHFDVLLIRGEVVQDQQRGRLEFRPDRMRPPSRARKVSGQGELVDAKCDCGSSGSAHDAQIDVAAAAIGADFGLSKDEQMRHTERSAHR